MLSHFYWPSFIQHNILNKNPILPEDDCCLCQRCSSHKKALQKIVLCGSTMGMVGCAGETEWALEKPSIPPYFQLSAHFSRIIDGSEDVQLSGMKMSQSLGSQGRKRPWSGAAGGRVHAAANAEEWAQTSHVISVNMLSWRVLYFWRKRETLCPPCCLHWLPGVIRYGWTPKTNPPPLKKLISGEQPPDENWQQLQDLCDQRMLPATRPTQPWQLTLRNDEKCEKHFRRCPLKLPDSEKKNHIHEWQELIQVDEYNLEMSFLGNKKRIV